MDTRYTIILIDIKKCNIANIKKRKTYDPYHNEILYEIKYTYSRPKFSINRISV
jgi:hypothetical protein